MSELERFNDLIENNNELEPLMDLINQIMELPEDNLDNTMMDVIKGAMTGAWTPALHEEAVREAIKGMEAENISRNQAAKRFYSARKAMDEFIDGLNPSNTKRELLNVVFELFYKIFDDALDRYHNFDIELPIQLDEGAQIPTYAHGVEDAAADLYAADTITIPAHSIGTMIRTGVHIQLPENWVAFIFPRSSIGAKTPLRLSNSVGIIDSSYRGPLGVLYDNISDSDYTINAGDRIAQLMVMPNYHFKARVVETLEDTERGQGGFGSSGK